MTAANDSNRQTIARLQRAANKEHAWRVRQITQRPRISLARFEHNLDSHIPATFDFPFRIDFVASSHDRLTELRATPLDRTQFARRGREHGLGAAEVLEQLLPDARSDA